MDNILALVALIATASAAWLALGYLACLLVWLCIRKDQPEDRREQGDGMMIGVLIWPAVPLIAWLA